MLELQKAPWNHKDLNKPKDAQNYTKCSLGTLT